MQFFFSDVTDKLRLAIPSSSCNNNSCTSEAQVLDLIEGICAVGHNSGNAHFANKTSLNP